MELVTLGEAKLWLRVDEDYEDEQIQMLIDAACSYVEVATGRKFGRGNAKAKTLALTVISDWFENRELTGKDVSGKMRHIVRSFIWQLRYEPDEGDDDGN